MSRRYLQQNRILDFPIVIPLFFPIPKVIVGAEIVNVRELRTS
jgi:hypothetical protein